MNYGWRELKDVLLAIDLGYRGVIAATEFYRFLWTQSHVLL